MHNNHPIPATRTKIAERGARDMARPQDRYPPTRFSNGMSALLSRE